MLKENKKCRTRLETGVYAVFLSALLLSLFNQGYSSPEKIFEFPFKSKGSLLFYADIYQFEAQSAHSKMEISYAIPLAQFASENNMADSLKLDIHLIIMDSLGKELSEVRDQKTVSPDEYNVQRDVDFVDLRSFLIKLPQIQLSLEIAEEMSGRYGMISEKISVRSFSDHFSISDPLIASHIQKAKEPGNFTKHGLLMIPSPSRQFWLEDTEQKLYAYYEINNMFYDENDPSYYATSCRVSEVSGNIIYEEKKNALLKKSENTSRVEIIPLDDFTNGIYKLTIAVSDLKYETTHSVDRYFWINSTDMTEGLYLPMEDADVEKYFDQIKYIATDREKEIYKRLDAKGKQEFIIRFWQKRDPTPGTPTNEFMIDHFEKLAYIEKAFTGGINSDRARILMEYGTPLDIERFPSMEGVSRAVEIWTYGINGTTEFVFVDRTRDGVYVLVHSTHPDEYSNPDWQKDLE